VFDSRILIMIKVDFLDMPCHMIDPDMICSTVTLGTYNEVYVILYIFHSGFDDLDCFIL
jgi:hypothetical protein